MTIAFDSASTIQLSSGSGDWTISFTPSGTPAGIIVLPINRNSASDGITGVDYGGVAMTEAAASPHLGGTSASYGYWLSAPASGTQNCVIHQGASSVAKRAVIFAVTATSGQIGIVDSDATSGNLDDPSVTLQLGSSTCLAFMSIHSYQDNVSTITPGSGFSDVAERDDGTDVCGWYRSTSTVTGDTACAVTTTAADDCNLFAIAVEEISAATKKPVHRYVNKEAVHRASRW